MPIEHIKEQLYNFIKNRENADMQTILRNLRVFVDTHVISRKDMGYAITLLKKEHKVGLDRKGYFILG